MNQLLNGKPTAPLVALARFATLKIVARILSAEVSAALLVSLARLVTAKMVLRASEIHCEDTSVVLASLFKVAVSFNLLSICKYYLRHFFSSTFSTSARVDKTS